MLTFIFVQTVADRIDSNVHQLPLFVAATLTLACFAAFLYLIDYAARLLRPISILTRVGNEGLAVIKSVYPDPEPRCGSSKKPAPHARSAGPCH